MPGGFPLGLELANANSLGMVDQAEYYIGAGYLPQGSASNLFGSYVQITSSTPCDCCWLEISLSNNSTSGSVVVNLATGASGSEVVLVPNLVFTYTSFNIPTLCFPINIPAGTRIAANAAMSNNHGDASNQYTFIALRIFDGAFTQMDGPSGVDSIGFNSGTSYGTPMTPATTNYVKGSYVQLTSSTTRDYIGIFAALDTGGTYPVCNTTWDTDIAIGASGSEQVLIPDILPSAPAYTSGTNNDWTFRPVCIPAGTRIAARCSVSGNASTTTLTPGITIYGVYK